jgi:predicted RNase H-like HicB family nuclease
MKRRSYVARYEQDENGYWSVIVKIGRKRSAVSDGQTLPKARRRIRQAVALLLDTPESSFDLVDDVVFPKDVRRALQTYEGIKEATQAKVRELETARRRAARALASHGLSRRDAGEILGLTGQRVQQLLAG